VSDPGGRLPDGIDEAASPVGGEVASEPLSRWRDRLHQARSRIAPYVLQTPLLASPTLSRRWGREVLVKLDNLQHTGSFKLRGAASRLTLLSSEERERGVVACSSGNHGRAVAHMSRELGIDAVVCVPTWVDPVKAAAIRAAGARIVAEAASYDEADRVAREIGVREGRTFIHPFDDPAVIAGQGSVGLEILEARPDIAEIAVALSGGGLASGVALAAATVPAPGRPPKVTAVSARNARVMWESLAAGRPVEMEEADTLAGALLGGIDLGNRYTFGLVKDLVHRHVLVSEREIAESIRFSFSELRTLVEGGGAVPLAALLAGRLGTGQGTDDAPLAIIIGGGNLDPELLQGLVSRPGPGRAPVP
jgi:threonine dehydratase